MESILRNVMKQQCKLDSNGQKVQQKCWLASLFTLKSM